MDGTVTVFRVLSDEERTRLEVTEDLLGVGVQFPSGWCMVDWNLEAYEREDRLDNPHYSFYGSLDDVRQGTGGEVDVRFSWDVESL